MYILYVTLELSISLTYLTGYNFQVLETSPSLQYDLLDFISHLTSENYDTVPDDLVKLGFLKEEKLQTVMATGFLEPLTYMLKQAGQGGGGSKIR